MKNLVPPNMQSLLLLPTRESNMLYFCAIIRPQSAPDILRRQGGYGAKGRGTAGGATQDHDDLYDVLGRSRYNQTFGRTVEGDGAGKKKKKIK